MVCYITYSRNILISEQFYLVTRLQTIPVILFLSPIYWFARLCDGQWVLTVSFCTTGESRGTCLSFPRCFLNNPKFPASRLLFLPPAHAAPSIGGRLVDISLADSSHGVEFSSGCRDPERRLLLAHSLKEGSVLPLKEKKKRIVI
jgi:hypothetical protein